MILELFQWLQSLSFMTFIRESGLEYPIVMSTHLTCIAIFGGLIVITDLRLLGWAFKDKSIADVVNGLRWWKRVGFIIMFSMGFTLFGSKAADYYPNPYFWIKMSFLVLVLIHAIVFRPSVYNHPEELDASPGDSHARQSGRGALANHVDHRPLQWTSHRLLRAARSKRATSFQSARTANRMLSPSSPDWLLSQCC